jgi:PadR family transcriptional regulator PadR
MPKAICPRHGSGHPCACAMGNVYRFIEPVLLLMLKEKKESYGYDLSAGLAEYALTDAEIERAALYRTLRRLEQNGYVTSAWESEHAGPARRIYSLTDAGQEHLREWGEVLERLGGAMLKFSAKAL